MAYIYAFAPDGEDCSTIGLVGALMDEDAEFSLMAGEFGELTFRHPVDPWGKHRALVNGAVLRTMVPMRLCPGVRENGEYIRSVDEYTVASTATKGQRYIYSKAAGGKKKKLLRAGQTVAVTGVADASDDNSRYRVKLGRVSGWMERRGLTVRRRDVPVEGNAAGLEAVQPSYAVRQQLFRIYEVSPVTGADNPGYVEVKARRIAYDLMGNVSLYRTDGAVTCREALEGILANTVMPHDFAVYTDIGDSRVGFDARDINPIRALADPEDGALARWGAEVVSDDYDIYVLRRAGLDRGVRIEYGRNLLGVTVKEDASKAARAIRPVGKAKDGAPLYLDGRVVNGRHGYNYNSGTGACADWLPEGYRFLILPDGTVQGSTVVRDGAAPGAAAGIAVVEVRDAKVERGNSGVTAAVARRMLAAEAVSRFEGGCDLPEISMDVDFILLGDTEDCAQYRHLEPLFVYDSVHVRDARMGISAEISLTGLTWRVRQERVAGARFGALGDVAATVSGWQISSLNGGRILPGTLTAAQLEDGVISARHVQADSISTDALQANSVTAGKIAAGAITAQHIQAGSVTADRLQAGSITAAQIAANTITSAQIAAGAVTTELLAAGAVTAAKIAAQTITANQLQAGLITAQSGLIAVGAIQTAQIADGSITAAKIVSLNADVITAGTLSVQRLLLVGENGLIYNLNAAASGLSAQQLSASEYRQHLNGTVIVAKSVTAAQIAAAAITGNEIAANTIKAGNIDVASLVASQAFIDELKTRQIVGDSSITMIAGTASSAQSTANSAATAAGNAQSSADSAQAAAEASMRYARSALQLDGDGLHVGRAMLDGDGNVTGYVTSEVLIDEASVNIRKSGTTYSRFASDYVQFGDYQLRRSRDGGLVFKMR